MSDDPADLGSSAFLRVLRGLLRPLVRTLIARGVTAPALYRLLKQVYVEVAEDEFGLKGKPPTDSRVSLLTGVHRRDVRSFRNAGEGAWQQERQKTTLLATVLGRWLADAAYSTPLGPRPLAKSGGENSFEDLVRTIGKDVRPRTVLDELLRQNLVSETEDGLLHLQTGSVLGPQENDQQIIFFAANVGDHLAAAAENLQAEEPPFLERAVFYNGLSQASIDALETQARTLSQPVLVALNKEAHAFQTADSQQPGGTKRFRFGVYFYSEDSAPGANDPKDTE